MHTLFVGLSLLILPPALCDTAQDTFQKRHLSDARTIQKTCANVVKYALVHDIDPIVAVATCESETTCRPGLIGSAGERGPLQVSKYWVKGSIHQRSQLELTIAGVRALSLLRKCRTIDWKNLQCKTVLKKRRPWPEVLCHYNGGNVCGSKGIRYSGKVLRNTKRLRRDFKQKYGT